MERYVHLECSLCGERLYTDLSEFVQGPPSQSHLEAEIYTNREPDNLAGLCDKIVGDKRGVAYNCSQACHGHRWLIDAGTGYVNRHGHRYALACGSNFVRIKEVPKVAVCMTIRASRDAFGSIVLSCVGIAGGVMATIIIEDAAGETFGKVRTQLIDMITLAKDALPRFVLVDGTLLTSDYYDSAISDLFVLP